MTHTKKKKTNKQCFKISDFWETTYARKLMQVEDAKDANDHATNRSKGEVSNVYHYISIINFILGAINRMVTSLFWYSNFQKVRK